MSLQGFFNIVIVVFTVSNLGALGLETNLREALKTWQPAPFKARRKQASPKRSAA